MGVWLYESGSIIIRECEYDYTRVGGASMSRREWVHDYTRVGVWLYESGSMAIREWEHDYTRTRVEA